MNVSPTMSIVLAFAMLAVFMLLAGGSYLLRTRRDPKRGWLMIVAALVLLGNVLIWTM